MGSPGSSVRKPPLPAAKNFDSAFRACVLAWAVSLLSVARGADIHWINANGGDWNRPENWDPPRVPTAQDHAHISSNGDYRVMVGPATRVGALTLAAGSGTQTLVLGLNSVLFLDGPGTGNARATLSLEGGILGGTGDLTLEGALQWKGGTLLIPLRFRGGEISASGGSKALAWGTAKGALINSGWLVWAADYVTLGNGSVIENQAGATLELRGTNATLLALGATPGVITNAGTILKADTGVANLSGAAFHNAGSVDVGRGTLRLASGGRSTGSFVVHGAGVLEFVAGTHRLEDGSELAGDGTVAFTGGTTEVDGRYEVGVTRFGGYSAARFNRDATSGILELDAGEVAGGGSLTVGELRWSAGSIKCLVRCAGGTCGPRSNKLLDGGRLVNSGRLVVTGDSLYLSHGAILSNLVGAEIDLTDKGIGNGGGVPNRIDNAGRFKTGKAGAWASVIGVDFYNSGTVETSGNGLVFHGAYVQAAGETCLREGSLQVMGGLRLSGGVLCGTNTLLGSVTNLGGIVRPGLPVGTLTITGHYVQEPGGTLAIDLGGTVPGSGHDQLQVGTSPSHVALRGGTLEVSLLEDFVPVAGSEYTFLVNGPGCWSVGRYDRTNSTSGPLELEIDYTTSFTETTLRVVRVPGPNTAPSVAPVVVGSLRELQPFTLQLQATDADLPAQTLTWRLTEGPPGLAVSPDGLLSWTPTETQGWPRVPLPDPRGRHPVVVRVTDDGVPRLHGLVAFELVVEEVNDEPVLERIADRTLHVGSMFTHAVRASDADVPVDPLTFELLDHPGMGPRDEVQGGVLPTGGPAVTWLGPSSRGPNSNAKEPICDPLLPSPGPSRRRLPSRGSRSLREDATPRPVADVGWGCPVCCCPVRYPAHRHRCRTISTRARGTASTPWRCRGTSRSSWAAISSSWVVCPVPGSVGSTMPGCGTRVSPHGRIRMCMRWRSKRMGGFWWAGGSPCWGDRRGGGSVA